MEQQTIPDIFISYSRKDIAFAKLIRESLIQSGFNIWIDWERIPTGVEWWKTIEKAIKESNTFLFIISQTSIASPVCKDEINVALQNNKRIIPVIVDDLSAEVVGEFVPDLRKINWIIFQRERIFHIEVNPQAPSDKPEDSEVALPGLPQYEQALEKLSREIHTDWEWVTYHTRLQSDALRWQETNFLLRGVELEEAERRLLAAAGKDPQPTLLQTQFVTASRQEETRRQVAERALEQKAARRQRLFLWAVGVGLVIAFALMLLFLNQRDQYLAETFVRATAEANAIDQRNTALNRQLAAQARNVAARTLDAGLLLAVEAGRASSQPDVQNTLLDVLQLSPTLLHYIPGQPHGFSQISISQDGKLLAAGRVDNSVQLYDLSSGKLLGKPLTGPPSEVTAVDFSPDMRTLAAACNDPLVFLWDISDPIQPKPLPTLKIEMSSAQQTIAADSNGKIFSTWTGRFWLGLNGLWANYGDTPEDDARIHTYGAFSLRYSPDGSLLAVGMGDATVRLWDIKAGKWASPLNMKVNVPTPGLETGSVFGLSFSRDGTLLAGSAGIGVRVWDIPQRKIVAQRNCLTGSSQIYLPAAIDPSGKRMIFTCTSYKDDLITPTLRIVDLQGKSEDIDQSLPATLLTMAFNPGKNSELMAFGTTDNSVLFWNLATGQAVGEPLRTHDSEVVSLQFTQDGDRIVSADWNHNLAVWSATGQTVSRLANRVALPAKTSSTTSQSGTLGITFSGDGRQLFLSRYLGTQLFLADPESDQPAREVAAVSEERATIEQLASLPKLNAFAWLQNGGKVVIIDPSTFQVMRTFTANSAAAGSPVTAGVTSSYDFDPPGLRLAETAKGEVRLWDLQTGALLPQKFSLAGVEFSSPAFSPDGTWLSLRAKFTKEQTEALYLWQPASGKTISMPLATGAPNGGLQVAFSPDNRSLAYSRLDKNFYLCDLGASALSCRLGGSNTSWITSLAFNHAGTGLASLAFDGSFNMWDSAGKAVGNLLVPAGYFAFEWSPDDQRIAVSGNASSVWMMDASLQPWSATACRTAGRNLSLAEGETYFSGQAYRKTCRDQPLHPAVVERLLVTQARALAANQVDAALADFAKALPLEAALLPELKAATAAFSPGALGLRAMYLSNRDASAALDAAGAIKTLYGAKALSADVWNAVCWFSSLYGQPAGALPFCETALQLDPGNPSYLDSRGLARALTGDLTGAAADFKVFVAYTRQAGRYEPYGKLRDGWIVELEKGQNPINAAVMETLKKE